MNINYKDSTSIHLEKSTRLNELIHFFDYCNDSDLIKNFDFNAINESELHNKIINYIKNLKTIFSQNDELNDDRQKYLFFQQIKDILKNLKIDLEIYRSISKKNIFYQDFPYIDIFNVILLDYDEEVTNLLFACVNKIMQINIEMSFDINIIPHEMIDFLCSSFEPGNQNYIIETTEFVSNIIQKSHLLCEYFIKNGLFQVIDDYIPNNFVIYALESVIVSADVSHFKTLLAYSKQLLETNKNDVVLKAFNCFSLILTRFDSSMIDFKTLIMLCEYITRFLSPDFGESPFKTALSLPSTSSHLQKSNEYQLKTFSIFEQIIIVLQDYTISTKICAYCLKTLIHFYDFWKDLVTIDFINSCFCSGYENSDYKRSLLYFKCIFTYYHPENYYQNFNDNNTDSDFELYIFKICLNLIDSEMFYFAIVKMHEIVSYYIHHAKSIETFKNLMSDYIITKILEHSENNEVVYLGSELIKILSEK